VRAQQRSLQLYDKLVRAPRRLFHLHGVWLPSLAGQKIHNRTTEAQKEYSIPRTSVHVVIAGKPGVHFRALLLSSLPLLL